MRRANVDERIVELSFDNAQFERETKKSMETLDNLKRSMNFDSLNTGLEKVQRTIGATTFNPLATSLGLVNTGFTGLEQVAIRVLGTISEKIMSVAGDAAALVKELTIDQVGSGFDKYSEKTKAVQTIIAATRNQYSDEGEQMKIVTEQLAKLNWFTDETSYGFLDMVSNIGKFTSNAINLEDAVTAMEGISVWAALAGAGPQQAAHAMYNLAQAIGRGYIQLIDWKSIENANMQTAEFKQMVIDAAVALGTLKDVGGGKYLSGVSSKGVERYVSVSDFTSTMSVDKWFTNDVLMRALSRYGDFTNALYEEMQVVNVDTASAFLEMINSYKEGTLDMAAATQEAGVSADVLEPILQRLSADEYDLGRRAFMAAQEALTLEQSLESVKDAASTSWMNIWEYIFGNYQEAKVLWTNVANELWDVLVGPVKDLEGHFQRWNELGGRNSLLRGFTYIWDNLKNILSAVSDAFHSVFGSFDHRTLLRISTSFMYFTHSLILSEDQLANLRTVLQGVFTVFSWFGKVVDAFFEVFGDDIFTALSSVGSFVSDLLVNIANVIIDFDSFVTEGNYLVKAFESIRSVMISLGTQGAYYIGKFVDKIKELFDYLDSKFGIIDKLSAAGGFISRLLFGDGSQEDGPLKWLRERLVSVKSLVNRSGNSGISRLFDSLLGNRLPDELQTGPHGSGRTEMIQNFNEDNSVIGKIKSFLGRIIGAVTKFFADFNAVLFNHAEWTNLGGFLAEQLRKAFLKVKFAFRDIGSEIALTLENTPIGIAIENLADKIGTAKDYLISVLPDIELELLKFFANLYNNTYSYIARIPLIGSPLVMWARNSLTSWNNSWLNRKNSGHNNQTEYSLEDFIGIKVAPNAINYSKIWQTVFEDYALGKEGLLAFINGGYLDTESSSLYENLVALIQNGFEMPDIYAAFSEAIDSGSLNYSKAELDLAFDNATAYYATIRNDIESYWHLLDYVLEAGYEEAEADRGLSGNPFVSRVETVAISIWDKIAELAAKLAAKVKESFDNFRQVHPMVDDICTFIEEMVATIKEKVLAGWGFISSKLPSFESISNFFSGVASAISTAYQNVKPYLPSIDDIFNALVWIKDRAIELAKEIIPYIPTWDTVVESVSKIAGKVWEFISAITFGKENKVEYFGGLFTAFEEFSLVPGGEGLISHIEEGETFAERLVIAVKGIFGYIGELGSAIIEGLTGFTGLYNVLDYVEVITKIMQGRAWLNFALTIRNFSENGLTLFKFGKEKENKTSIANSILKFGISMILIAEALTIFTKVPIGKMTNRVELLRKILIFVGIFGVVLYGISEIVNAITLKGKDKEGNSIGKELSKLGTFALGIALGLLALAAAIAVYDLIPERKLVNGLLKLAAAALVLGFAYTVFSMISAGALRLSKGKELPNVGEIALKLAGGLALFALAIVGFDLLVSEPALKKAGITLGVTFGIVALLGWWLAHVKMDAKNVSDLSKMFTSMVTAISVLAAVAVLIGFVVGPVVKANKEGKAILNDKFVSVIGALLMMITATAALAGIVTIIKDVDAKKLQAFAIYIGTVAGLFFVVATSIMIMDLFLGEIPVGETVALLLSFGAVVLAIGASIGLIYSSTNVDIPKVITAGLAMIAVIIVLGNAFSKILKNSFWKNYETILAIGGGMAAVIFTLTILITALGNIGDVSIGGIVALGVAALPILAFGKALSMLTGIDWNKILWASGAMIVVSLALAAIGAAIAVVTTKTGTFGQFVGVLVTITGSFLGIALAIDIALRAIGDFMAVINGKEDPMEVMHRRASTKGDALAGLYERTGNRMVNAFDYNTMYTASKNYVDATANGITDEMFIAEPQIYSAGEFASNTYNSGYDDGMRSHNYGLDAITSMLNDPAGQEVLNSLGVDTGSLVAGGIESGVMNETDILSALTPMLDNPQFTDALNAMGIDVGAFFGDGTETGAGNAIDLMQTVLPLFGDSDFLQMLGFQGELGGGEFQGGLLGGIANMLGVNLEGGLGDILSSEGIHNFLDEQGGVLGVLFGKKFSDDAVGENGLGGVFDSIKETLGIQDLSEGGLDTVVTSLGSMLGGGILDGIVGQEGIKGKLAGALESAFGIDTSDPVKAVAGIAGVVGRGLMDAFDGLSNDPSFKDSMILKAVQLVKDPVRLAQKLVEIGKILGSGLMAGIAESIQEGYTNWVLRIISGDSSVDSVEEFMTNFVTGWRNFLYGEPDDNTATYTINVEANYVQSDDMNWTESLSAEEVEVPMTVKAIPPTETEIQNDLVDFYTAYANEISKSTPEDILGDKEGILEQFIESFSKGEITPDEFVALWNLTETKVNGQTALSDTVKEIVGFSENNPQLQSALEQIDTAGIGIGSRLIFGIINPTNVLQMVAAALGLKDTFIEQLQLSEPQAEAEGNTLGGRVSSGILSAKPTLLSFTDNLGSGFIGRIRTWYGETFNSGGYLGSGLIGGLQSKTQSILGAVSGLCSSAVSTMRSWFGIHSPSTVTAEMGMYLDYGLANGLAKYAGTVHDAAGTVSSSTVTALTDPLTLLTDRMNTGFSDSPITPVFDLSNVQNGIHDMNGLLIGNSSQLSAAMRSPNNTVNVIAESGILNEIRSIREEMNMLHQAITELNNLQVTLDSRALVGSLAKPMDNALGRRTVHAARRN